MSDNDSEYDGDELERLEAQLHRHKRGRRRCDEEEEPPRRLQRLRRNRDEEEEEEEEEEGEERSGEEEGEEGSDEEEAAESSEEEEAAESSDEEEEDVSWRRSYKFIDNSTGRLLHDPGWREMYKYFDAGNPEPPGYADHPDYHIPPHLTADQLWQRIRVKTTQPGFYYKYGVKAERRTINGEQVTILHRAINGTQYVWCDNLTAGNYNMILLDIVPLLLPQKPFQPPFDGTLPGEWKPKPRFLGYEPDAHVDLRTANMQDALRGNPLWCLCAMSSLKLTNPLKNLTAMKHSKNGLILMVGGLCAAHIMGYQYLNTVTKEDLNDENDGTGVAQYLGIAGDDD